MRALVRVTAALLAALAFLPVASPALAHATLVSSEPADGAVVATAPTQFVLSFNDPVSALVLRIVRADGQTTVLTNPPRRDTSLTMPAPPSLGEGTHVLSWRVVSLDGHPVGGSVVFSVGAPSAGSGLAAESSADPAVSAALWAFKVVLYLGIGVGIGGSFFLSWLAPGIVHGRTIVAIALIAGLVAAPLLVGLQGADALELPLSGLANKIAWQTGPETSFGASAILSEFALLGAVVSLNAPSRSIARGLSLCGLCGAGLALALSGHASAADPQWLMRTAVFVHSVSVTFWIGCLAPVGTIMRRGSELKTALALFSRAIPWVIAALVLSGVILAAVQVEQPRALFDTAYGKLLCAKLCCVAVLLLLATWNRFWLTPAIKADVPAARRKLAHSITAEVAIVILVLGLVASWRFTPPPRTLAIAATRPLHVHIHTGQAMADVTLESERVGFARARIVIMTGEFGGLDAKEVLLTLENKPAGIEAISRPARKGGDAVWRVEQLPLPSLGRWEVRIDILVNDFERIVLEGEIER